MTSIISVNTTDNQPIEVYYQDEVELQLDLNLMYIKSGQKEIQDYVDNVSKPEINEYVETEAKPLVTQIVNEIAEPVVSEYIETVTKPSIDEYVDSKKPELQAYVTQASNYADNSQASATASAGSAAAALTSANNAKTSETNAKTYENNALSSKNAAASSATSASNYANNSKIWAEGTDSQVQALGGSKSAKGWAEASTNLDYTNITNCITKIPQDIKLELNNGTLTLKAGSKVYVPNGAGKFDVITVQSDKSWGQTTYASGNIILFYRSKYNDLFALNDYACYSGSSSPTAINNMIWYDTTNGKIKWTNNKGSTWNDEGLSLPLSNSPYTNGTGFTSIDQIFNGFGYIGNTIFALPGVKGLIPNGFNTDGSLNSIEFTTTRVLTSNIETSYSNQNFAITLSSAGISYLGGYRYSNDENLNYNYNSVNKTCLYGKVSVGDSSRITSLTPNTAFHAVDYSEYAREVGRCAKVDEENTFEKAQNFSNYICKDSDTIDIDTNPSNQLNNQILFRDKNKVTYGWIQANQFADGSINMFLTGKSSSSGSTNSIQLRIPKSGDAQFLIPTPPTDDNSTKGATTAWVNSKKADIVGWGIPNYSAGVAKNKDVDYTAEKSGYLLEISGASPSLAASRILVNGIEVSCVGVSGTTGGRFWSGAYVYKGDRYRFAGETSVTRIFFPLRGA